MISNITHIVLFTLYGILMFGSHLTHEEVFLTYILMFLSMIFFKVTEISYEITSKNKIS